MKIEGRTGEKPMSAVVLLKRHPVFGYVGLTLLWSWTWWSLILAVVPPGGLHSETANVTALSLAALGSAGTSLIGLTLSGALPGEALSPAGSAPAVGAGWWPLVVLVPWGMNVAIVSLHALSGGQIVEAAFADKIGPAVGIGVMPGLFEAFGWRGFFLLRPPAAGRCPRHLPAGGLRDALVWCGEYRRAGG